MPPFLKAFLALLVGFALVAQGADGLDKSSDTTLDPAFAPGLASVKQATGFLDGPSGGDQTDWKPDLKLLVGFKAVEKSKRTIYFVELTTLLPPLTNTAGQLWSPALRTNFWAWSGTNKASVRQSAQYITALYPVRVCVFDEAGRKLKEGQTPMSWGMLTNGLFDMCRLSAEFFPHGTKSDPRAGNTNQDVSEARKLSDDENDELMRAMGGGFLWMMGMVGDLQTVPAVKNVWEKSHCALRMPGVWTMVTAVFTGFNVSLEPRVQDVMLTDVVSVNHPEPQYRLPVDLRSGKQNLSRVEIIIRPAHGAGMLLAGIRSIRAVHPTKPQNEFLAQVLATGAGHEEK